MWNLNFKSSFFFFNFMKISVYFSHQANPNYLFSWKLFLQTKKFSSLKLVYGWNVQSFIISSFIISMHISKVMKVFNPHDNERDAVYNYSSFKQHNPASHILDYLSFVRVWSKLSRFEIYCHCNGTKCHNKSKITKV